MEAGGGKGAVRLPILIRNNVMIDLDCMVIEFSVRYFQAVLFDKTNI